MLRFSERGGACGALVAGIDWANTPLGELASWPRALSATVANLLHTRQPMLLFWGPELIQFYNDSFVPSFGRGKHPAAMGQRARECWADAWPVVGAQIEAVMTRGEPVWFENAPVPIERNGRMEEVFWTYSYSPAYGDDGEIAGTLVIVTETTSSVLSSRRLASLSKLGMELSHVTTREGAVDVLIGVLKEAAADLPFVEVRPAGGPDRALAEIRIAAPVPGPVWPEPVDTALTCTVRGLELVFGVSPRLPLDDGLRSWVMQIVEQLGSVLHRIEIGEALQTASRAKDEFLAMLGHELRNPLAPIVSALDLMEHSATTTRERDVIARQVRHLIRLVDDLLDISRITRGVISLERKVIDLGDAARAAIEAATPLIEQRGHRLTVELARDAFVLADEARLVQVISNLLTNAARYTPSGGDIRVSLEIRGTRIQLSVADTGNGMDAELLPRVFDLFVQGTRGTDRVEGGLGLGLAIVKNLVELHGGTVTAHSDGPGRGSTFSVELELADRRHQAQIASKRPTPSGGPKRVLLVDDNEDAANLLGDIVSAHGHDVQIRHSPSAALSLLATFTPEVVVLDIGLPEMDGYQLASKVRDRCPGCKLIALTGYGQATDRRKALDAGFAAHVVKPVRVADLLEMIAH